MRLQDRRAFVTGGGTGIGRATAILLAREGARVFVVGRRAAPLDDVVGEIDDTGGEAHAGTADVRDAEAVRATVENAADRLGGLDILVNAAGYAPDWTAVHETSDEEWRRVQDINLDGAFRTARAALPHLVDGGGSIVNVASISALKASNSVASYAAAKAGLIALTRCIAAEYGWRGVRCNCVVPSWVETPMTEAFLDDPTTREDVAGRHALQRVATPDEIARAIVYLAGDDAAFVTGATHAVDGGMSAL